jgi:hypothetical protein
MTAAPRISYVTDGREAIGFILARGLAGFEGFTREEQSLGLPVARHAACSAASV